MTIKHQQFENDSKEEQLTTLLKDSLVSEKKNSHAIRDTTADYYSTIRKSSLYRGQLAYIKEFLLKEDPTIDEATLVERLDISPEIAKLLLADAIQK